MENLDPLKSATEMGKQVKLGSVLNSILWSIPFQLAALVIVSFGSNGKVVSFLIWSSGVTIVVLLSSFIGILLFGNKNLLRSEDHVLLMRALDILGDQDHDLKEVENSTVKNNPSIALPSTVELPESKEQNHE